VRRYSRENPSLRYQELISLNRMLHVEGDKSYGSQGSDPETTFNGKSLFNFISPIKAAVDEYQLKTLLDYGCGKATVHHNAELETPDGRKLKGLKEIWGLDDVALYDPGHQPYATLPSGTFDGVVCTDVLEHCPEEDIDWIIEELFGFARKYLLCTIACYPAKKRLPGGENAHVTQKPPGWWIDKIETAAAKRPSLQYDVRIDIIQNQRALLIRNLDLGAAD